MATTPIVGLFKFSRRSEGNALQTAMPIATWVDALTLTSTTAESYTVPANTSVIRISADTALWYNKNGTAVAITADVADGSASTYQPIYVRNILLVSPGDVISMVSAAGSHISIECWK